MISVSHVVLIIMRGWPLNPESDGEPYAHMARQAPQTLSMPFGHTGLQGTISYIHCQIKDSTEMRGVRTPEGFQAMCVGSRTHGFYNYDALKKSQQHTPLIRDVYSLQA